MLQDDRGASRAFRRIGRHLGWARRQGVGRLIEEDQLNPIERLELRHRKRTWRRSHKVSGTARPVYLVGLQRSGTNMVVRGLERSAAFDVYNENDRRAFDRFLLRPDPVVRSLVLGCRHDYALFKPLCDSHRIAHLLDELDTPTHGRAIWAYRGVDGRVRSAIAKFGSINLEALQRIAAGEGSRMWQAGGLSEERLALIDEIGVDTMTPETAAALFWYLRNGLYFDLHLDRREDVILSSYDAFLADPEGEMRGLCSFLDFPYAPELVAHVRSGTGGGGASVEIDPRVRTLCDELQRRLDDARTRTDRHSP